MREKKYIVDGSGVFLGSRLDSGFFLGVGGLFLDKSEFFLFC